MTQLFETYFNFFLHPISVHKKLRENREQLQKMKQGRLFTLVDESYKPDGKLEFTTLTLVSWLFILIFAFYTLTYIHLGDYLSAFLAKEGYFPGFSISSLFQKKFLLISTLVEVVFFPLSAWIYVKFWRVLIVFFANLFVNEVEEGSLDDVVNSSLVGNFFLIIPVLGKFFKSISSVFYIFWGLKHNLKFTTAQSLIIIASPLLITAIFLLMMALYVMLIVNLYQF